ncbi:sulfite exporter TauE/SafE family protein [Ectobacillus antri]|jgi:uncharacterized membrane protein YfcA|uniref:Probable membrane transporter protein n=1 Tax=Ectobacillus antri TaxID=2486280 RepID=A0ABT6H6R1_9BACI|nr:sulfite exporter TauE/SafE family protein [Ectobacillus antri]MDG4657411.1 sulfite exporter TauE/SafE family protein [Ectobacillus antri]MDG5754458.1 sulfite exporter TauE/SafE family protein [Ectobacillus antri]
MKKLLVFIFIGFMAQLIDGSLGMAYGVTSTTLLLTFGVAPAMASASVHLAEVVTTAASGASHIKFGNVDRHMVLRLILPGAVGAFVGACFLSNLPGDLVKPYVSLFLLTLGIYILFRFLSQPITPPDGKKLTNKQLVPLGLIAGFFDATGGGGWGPITTPVLLTKRNVAPRKVIGTVDTAEFAVALAATIGFVLSLGWGQVNWFWVGTLMAGGLVAAPIAAWLVRIIPSHLLGVLVGGLIIATNARTLLNAWGVAKETHPVIYTGIFIVWSIALFATIRNHRKIPKPKQVVS